MKRYRILRMDFDTRALILKEEIKPEWDEAVRQNHEQMHEGIRQSVLAEFGSADRDRKISDFIALGQRPFSIVAYHNKFLRQIRASFIGGNYYPSLTGAVALGERILNHLIRALRQDFSGTPEYKNVAHKESFDWDIAERVLESWRVFLPDVEIKFRELRNLRWRAIHFDPATDTNDRPLALEAITLLSDIIQRQFGAWGDQPWLLILPGEPYIRKAFEADPFVRRVYLPSCTLVGPEHILEGSGIPFVAHDPGQYEDREVTDQEFGRLRQEFTARPTPPS